MRYNGIPLRHEVKYLLPYADYRAMRGRLAAFMRPDEHCDETGGYHVRSLYFDDPMFSDMWDKQSGVEKRSKTRIRVYNKSSGVIKLERKIKVNQYIGKQSARLTPELLGAILDGETGVLLQNDQPVLHRFYADQKLRRLRPSVIVDYRREAYMMQAGNVRVTFDMGLQAAVGDWSLFHDRGLIFYDAYPPQMLTMEIKFDDFLPGSVRKIIRPYTARRSEISKYALCLKALKRDFLYSKGVVL